MLALGFYTTIGSQPLFIDGFDDLLQVSLGFIKFLAHVFIL